MFQVVLEKFAEATAVVEFALLIVVQEEMFAMGLDNACLPHLAQILASA